MTADRAVAEAFSSHRFTEAYDRLDDDVVWTLVGATTLTGRAAVIEACEQTRRELEGTATRLDRSLVIAGQDAVAVDTVTTYTAPDGEVSTVSSCDLYEFAAGSVVRIVSYTVELVD